MREILVHPSAFVEDGVTLGDGTRIWHNAHIRSGAEIGAQTIVGKNVYVDAGVNIGARCKIQNNALLYRGSRLGDGVFVGPAVVLTNDLYPRAVNPDGSLKGLDDWSLGEILVEEGASLGSCAVVLSGVRIGPWAVVGAGSVVRENVPSHGVVVGVPGRFVGSACFCGRIRHDRCPDCGWSESESQ